MKDDPTSLDRFHDLVVPPPAPWWPPTPGWWIVLSLAALVVMGMLLRTFFRWQADRYRREALVLLDASDLVMISPLLKRVALAVWPRERIADLTGKAWLDFLDRSAGMEGFVNGRGSLVETIVFNPAAQADQGEMKRLAAVWIKRHRRELLP